MPKVLDRLHFGQGISVEEVPEIYGKWIIQSLLIANCFFCLLLIEVKSKENLELEQNLARMAKKSGMTNEKKIHVV